MSTYASRPLSSGGGRWSRVKCGGVLFSGSGSGKKEDPFRVYRPLLLLLLPRTPGRLNVEGGRSFLRYRQRRGNDG